VTDVASTMVGDRSRYGLFVSAVGAGVLAVSVFLPWYAVGFATHAAVGGVDGRLATLSAFHALANLRFVFLGLAGLALLDALLPLARGGGPVPGGAGGSVVLLGLVAVGCVLFRMLDLPTPVGQFAPTLREGAWLALLGGVTMVLGGMWPRCVYSAASADANAAGAWPGLSGWTVGG
jgi:hypothetical protein